MQSVGRTRRQEFEEIDRPNLRPLPEKPYVYAEIKTATVNIDYHVEFDEHRYSVPYLLIHQKVDIHATEWMVEIFHHGKSVAIHPRNFRRGRFFHPAGTYASQSSIYGGYQPGSIDRMGQQDRPSNGESGESTLNHALFQNKPIDLAGHT